MRFISRERKMHLRRKIQTFSTLVLNSSFLFELKSFCLPVLNCHSCPLAVLACPIGIIGQFSALHLFPFLIGGLLLFFAAVVGRLFCGWCCPFGLFQDLLYRIPFPKILIPKHFEKLKYLLLIGSVVIIPFFWGTTTPLFFCKFCPPATLQSAIPWAVINGKFSDMSSTIIRFTVFLIVTLLLIANERAFCRVLCPLGALMGIGNKFSLAFIHQNNKYCNNCKSCEDVCSMGVSMNAVSEGNRSAECILCLQCARKCSASRRIKIGSLN